jgi:NAD(P)H-hydrate epimerase
MIIQNEIRKKWKKRRPDSHKGDYGRVFILAGSQGFTGAAHLTATAALRAGAGLVTLGVPEKVYPVLARREAEVMVRPFPSNAQGTFRAAARNPILKFAKSQDVIAIGPGLSQNPETQKLVRSLAAKIKKPLILDADALNALAGKALNFATGRTIVTPHPGEFGRLFGKAGAGEKERKTQAAAAAKKSGAIVVLKGRRTVVASPDGKVYVNTTGNPGMATGGTGDVLTGIIAALAGQKLSLWDAACFGVYFHGLAGDLAAREKGQTGLIAGDLIDFLPAALKKILKY